MSTIEEKSEEAWLDYEYRADGSLYSTCFKDGYIQGAKWALSHQWVRVEDCLPEIRQKIVWHSRARTPKGTCIDVYLNDTYDCEYKPKDVEHWMPIPPLPEARKEEEA